MTVRIVSRLILLLVALAAATALVVGGLSVLASAAGPVDASPLLRRDQAVAVQRAVETPAEEPAPGSPTPLVVLVFAGVVLMAALPPVHRVHVYYRYGSHYRPDWF